MIGAKELAALIGFTMKAHAKKAAKPSKAVRKWDGKTPYSTHPIWCAMTILAEPELDEMTRINGARALLLHDILEDTTAELPGSVSPAVRKLVEGMTFPGGSEQEMAEISSRPMEVKLLKLYDKTSNILDDVWMAPEKRRRYADYLLRLCEEVEPVYGKLNIILLARALAFDRLSTK